MTPHPHRGRLYIAAPLFSDAELEFNRCLREALGAAFDVYLPQEGGGLFDELVRSGAPPRDAARQIFERDLEALRASDALLIVLDGRSVDEGAAFELGVAYTLGKPCYGLQTDARRLLPTGNNPMIEGALRRVFHTVEELLAWAQTGQ
jgi:nucleoside 2-deoxyribosyltransferase